MTQAQIESATALAEIFCEIFLQQKQNPLKPAPDAAFDDITDDTLTKRIRLLQ